MKVNFAPNGVVQFDDVRIIHRNFSGEPSKYNRDGSRNFSIVIDDEEIADALVNDKNKYGNGWNVKIKPPFEEGDPPFMYLPVKIKFNGSPRDPRIYLVTGSSVNRVTEKNISNLDFIDIERVDVDIRPYDDIVQDKSFRSAYLYALRIVQRTDRFSEELAESEFPEE